jgi:hypothetical protein
LADCGRVWVGVFIVWLVLSGLVRMHVACESRGSGPGILSPCSLLICVYGLRTWWVRFARASHLFRRGVQREYHGGREKRKEKKRKPESWPPLPCWLVVHASVGVSSLIRLRLRCHPRSCLRCRRPRYRLYRCRRSRHRVAVAGMPSQLARQATQRRLSPLSCGT